MHVDIWMLLFGRRRREYPFGPVLAASSFKFGLYAFKPLNVQYSAIGGPEQVFTDSLVCPMQIGQTSEEAREEPAEEVQRSDNTERG